MIGRTLAECEQTDRKVHSKTGTWVVTVHEPLKRSRGGDPTDPNQGIGICAACHRFTEDFPAEATRLGLLVSSVFQSR